MPTAHPWTVRCDSCAAEIFWAINATTGRRMPIDAYPNPDGNVTVDADPRSLGDRLQLTAQVLTGFDLELARTDGTTVLYMPHFATCPDADGWKGITRAARRGPLKEHA